MAQGLKTSSKQVAATEAVTGGNPRAMNKAFLNYSKDIIEAGFK